MTMASRKLPRRGPAQVLAVVVVLVVVAGLVYAALPRQDKKYLTASFPRTVSLYEGSDDARWLYVGCRCPVCGALGNYGDWTSEFPDYTKLFERV